MKRFRALLVVGVAILGLTACTSNAGTKNPAPSQAASAPVAIDFWYSLGGKNGEVIESMVKEFNASQKEVVVKPTFQGNYYDNHAKVLASLPAGTNPDVTMIEIASVGAFADAGALEDLKTYTEGEDKVDMTDFVPGLLGNSSWKDTLYAIPFNRSTPLLYVNKTMLQEAGLDPAGPKSWDELKEYSKKLSIKDQRWGFSTPIDIWFYEALVFENGGKILSEDGKAAAFNSKEGIEPVEFWQDMIQEGIMKMPPGKKYDAWDVAAQDFINKKVAMIFTSTGDLNTLMEQAKDFEVGTAFLPAKKSFGVPTGGTNLAILAKSPEADKKAAWKFIKWMTEKERTTAFSKNTGYMPVRISAIEGDEMKALYAEKPQFKVAVDQLQYANPRPMVPGYKELQEIIMSEIQRAIIDPKVSVEEALNAAAEKGKALLK